MVFAARAALRPNERTGGGGGAGRVTPAASLCGVFPASAMLSTRIATALVLIPLVLAALFALPPFGWAMTALAVVVLAAGEWARLAGCERRGAAAFAAVVVASAVLLLLVPAAGFGARGWPP